MKHAFRIFENISKNGLKPIMLLIFISLLWSNIFAQSDCSALLKESKELYDKGLYRRVVENLADSSLICEWTKPERNLAQKLVIASYLELDEIEAAEAYTKKFLKSNPSYVADDNSDPSFFKKEIELYKVSPKLRLLLNFGIGKMFPDIVSVYPIWEAADYNKTYETQLKPVLKIGIEWFLFNNFSAKTGFSYATNAYQRNITALSRFEMKYTENFTEYQVPVSLNYYFRINQNWKTSLFAGMYLSQYTDFKADIKISDTTRTSEGYSLFDSGNLGDISQFRNKNNYGIFAGFTAGYEINRFSVFTEISYGIDFKNYTTEKQNVLQSEQARDHYFVDDVFKLRHFRVSLGVAYTIFYKIKKKYE